MGLREKPCSAISAWYRSLSCRQAAIDYTIGLARESGARVGVLHVLELPIRQRALALETPTQESKLVSDAVSQLGAAGVHAEGCVRSATTQGWPVALSRKPPPGNATKQLSMRADPYASCTALTGLMP